MVAALAYYLVMTRSLRERPPRRARSKSGVEMTAASAKPRP
jgi:hypothetical protein